MMIHFDEHIFQMGGLKPPTSETIDLTEAHGYVISNVIQNG